MTFQLDTSGTVHFSAAYAKKHGVLTFYRWSDLLPFTQGYIEAMLSGVCVPYMATEVPFTPPVQHGERQAAFSDLAPETLARISADCAKFLSLHPGWDHPDGGRLFWGGRNGAEAKVDSLFGRTCRDHFPPLTVQLGDDGKVRFGQ